MTTLTVFYDGQFWVGVYERNDTDGYAVARKVFGAEPSDTEIFNFTVNHYQTLVFSKPVEDSLPATKKINPKRLIRMIRDEIDSSGIGTKAQKAIKAEQERQKTGKVEKRKQARELKEKEKFIFRQQKRKKKKKGH